MPRRTLSGVLAIALLIAGCGLGCDRKAPAAAAKNVIVMINDGAGWGAWQAAAYWQYGALEKTPYADFPVKYGMTTYSLNTLEKSAASGASPLGYNRDKAWDVTPTDGRKLPYAGYRYLAAGATDSAAAATALAAGVKTYNTAVNYDSSGRPAAFVTLTARKLGKATGVITTVPFSHATPAAFGTQNISRNNYHEIARRMLNSGHLDLIMGTGAPGYNVNGTACGNLAAGENDADCATPYRYLAEKDWNRLQSDALRPAGAAVPWRIIRDREEFEQLANGMLEYDGPLLGVPRVAQTLQQQREAGIVGRDGRNPSGDAFIATVPTLAMMSGGALRHLSANRNGFFLMIEGGATDWAANSGSCAAAGGGGSCAGKPEYGRLIEEAADFNAAVRTVTDWVEANSSWEETLLIITTDHDNSMPMGPDADGAVPFQQVVNNGKGVMPGISFRATGSHSNALVPLWAKGCGAEGFAARVRGSDAGFARHVGHNNGEYVDNTDVHAVIEAALRGREVRALPY